LKILFAASCPSDRNLGVPGVMHSLADLHRAAGHEVRFLFRDREGRWPEVTFGWDLSRSDLARWADVVDVHAVDAWPLCRPRRSGPVVVARSHGLERVVHRRFLAAVARGEERISPVYRLYRGSIRLWLEKAAVRQADATLVLNASDHEECLRDLGGDPSKVLLVPNGYPAGFLDEPLDPGARGVAFVGSWLRRKGNDLAVEAITTLLRARPDVPVLLMGTGLPEAEIRSCFPPDIAPLVRIRTRFDRPDLPALLRGFGILLFPSRSEGYPLSLVEAMACGLAPVASTIPGVVDVVADDRSGVLVPSEEAARLSEALVALASDPARLERLRTGARDAVRSTSWAALATRQADLYRTLLDQRRSRR